MLFSLHSLSSGLLLVFNLGSLVVPARRYVSGIMPLGGFSPKHTLQYSARIEIRLGRVQQGQTGFSLHVHCT